MSSAITLRPLEDTDAAVIASWLAKAYVLKWYHDAAEWLNEINARHSNFSWIHHYIVMDSNNPIGFCQYYDCFDAQPLEDWYCVKQQGETFSIDYLIGEERYLGKGYGKQIVDQLTQLIMTHENAIQIIVQPELENLASVHVLLANGYTYNSEMNYYFKILK